MSEVICCFADPVTIMLFFAPLISMRLFETMALEAMRPSAIMRATMLFETKPLLFLSMAMPPDFTNHDMFTSAYSYPLYHRFNALVFYN